MARCNFPHHEDPSRVCIKIRDGIHIDHVDADGNGWTDPDAAERLKALTQRKGRPPRNSLGPLVNGARKSASTGVPQAALEAWDKDEWVKDAERVTLAFLRQRREDFTTAEHLWPLLDAPQEMRSLSVVVQRMLRGQKMVEVGATRLRGVYQSKDGVAFSENKLVPIYRSMIYAETVADSQATP